MVKYRVKGKKEKKLEAMFKETLHRAIDKGDVGIKPGTIGKEPFVALTTTLEVIASGSAMRDPSLSD
jgi:hypothetical protein